MAHYSHNVTIIKEMGVSGRFKAVNLSKVMDAGYEDDRKRRAKGTVNDKKLENNIVRAKTVIRELGLCNPWDWFVTLTLDQRFYDRYNLKDYQYDLMVFVRNYNRYCEDHERVRYVLIPEQHKDGAWHMHGLIRGIKPKDLYENDKGYLSWLQYERKFGFISMGAIKSQIRTTSYITKYVSKDMATQNRELGAHLYYCSRGLIRPETLFRGTASAKEWQYETEDKFCRISWFDGAEALANTVEIIEDTLKKPGAL